MKQINASVFGVVYEHDGEKVTQKFVDAGSSAEYEAKKYSKKFKQNVELWHFSKGCKPVKLCTIVFKS